MLADDDVDDCMLFREALGEMSLAAGLTTVSDGVELMRLLASGEPLPDAIFLDLNMPKKNGFECLAEIKNNPGLQKIPVFIYSTSFASNVIDLLYKEGARHYIRKPADFGNLRLVIRHALSSLEKEEGLAHTSPEKFVLGPDEC